ncbi:IS701 family transposase [Hymenobacter sp. PAMC 26628]|uniref:IS701 family transposase n=1 Tax=Hymenobacter sp. PAMC 26628 TaxID=1484118 RepID=UPI0007700111|nr:transposase [Hymenobacter sp. PAMC 26628]AMJ65285.1 transposase [Hymenobacter sp. PAMC 26628]AMJ65287.1 transposase [Hymenobacter sp. PAMC 26628]AMJ67905.1 transposase [Hymenobacter sp. PAMC 26628]
MLTQAKHIDYLLSTPRNYTCTHLAAHLPGVSHDEVNRFLRNSAFSANQLRALVLPLLRDSPEAFLLVDDSVQDKRYSRFIEVAKRQYSGTVHGPVTGIGLVKLVHSSGESGDFLPLDFRVYAPDADGLTKNEHFQAMFAQVVAEDKLLARTVLFDSWYAASANLKQIHRAGWTFFTTLKSNRLVSLSKESGYQGLDTLEPPASGWSQGVEVRLQQVPFAVKLFKLVATDGSIAWVVTNHLAAHLSREMVIEAVQRRWQAEEFHRSFKQLTGSEKCQCRKASAQRNHLTCCYLAWVSLRQHARAIGQTIYQAHQQPWSAFLRQQLQNPPFPVILPLPA